MYSIVSLILAVALFAGSFVGTPFDFGKVLSGELTFKIETRLNKPLDANLAKDMGNTSLDGLSAEFDVKYKVSEDLKKLEMQCDILTTGGGERQEMSYWIRTDYSDKNIPKVFMVMKQSKDDKYYIMDIQSPMITRGGNAAGLLGGLISPETISGVSKSMRGRFLESGTEMKEKDGVYTVVLDEATVKKMIKEIAIGMRDYLSLMFGMNKTAYSTVSTAETVGVIGAADGPTKIYVAEKNTEKQEEIQSQIGSAINEFFGKLDKVSVFADDAMVLTAELDDNKLPKTLHYDMNIHTNLYELTKVFDGSWNENIPKEAADLDMTISFDYQFHKLNEDITIDYPALTADNSVNTMDGEKTPKIDVNAVNVVKQNKLIALENKPFIENNTVYVPFREILNLYGVSDENILWNGGVITAEQGGARVEFTIGGTELKLADRTIPLEAKVLLRDGVTYVPVSVPGNMLACSLTNLFYGEDNSVIGGVVLISPRPIPRETQAVRFLLPSDADPMWEKYLYQAGDMAGVKFQVDITPVEHYREKTNLLIAAGEPSVMIGKYDDEFLNRLVEQGAIYPAEKIDDKYCVMISQAVKNPDRITEVIKHFIVLVNQQ